MTPRERLSKALNHEEPDRVPVDFGAGAQTGIMASTLYKIKKHYGLLDNDERIKIIEPYQMLGEIDGKTRDFFGLDVIGVFPRGNIFGFTNENWKAWTLFDGTPVWVPEKFNTTPDENGNIPMYAQGDRSYPPSAIMPKGGFYFDAIGRQKPIDEAKLDPRDNTEEFGLVSQADLDYLQKTVQDVYENTDSGIYVTLPGMAFGDIALVPAPFLKEPKGIRQVEEWYVSTVLRPDYIKKVFQIQSEIALQNLIAIHKAVGNRPQVVFMSGTDFGAQNAPMLSVENYRNGYLPFQKKLNDWIHQNTSWKTFMHCCGSIEPLIESIIEAGFDILNPVQCSAAKMSPALLKEKYGDRMVFWGGGIDTQKTLPFGSPQAVYQEVRQRIEIFNKGGGYIFNSIHNIQSNVPMANLVALFDALRDIRKA